MGLLALDDLVGALEWAEESWLDRHAGRRFLFALVARIVFQVADLLQTLRVLRVEQHVLLRDDCQLSGSGGLAQCVASHAGVDAAVVDRDKLDSQRHVAKVEEVGDARAGLQRFSVYFSNGNKQLIYIFNRINKKSLIINCSVK